jgi:phosphate transport system substrate-binding protein
VGGVVPVVNLPGIKPGELTLSGEVLGEMYLGKIKKWNDPAISALNRNVNFPTRMSPSSGALTVPGRALSGRTTSRRSIRNGKGKVGEGTTVSWPTGMGGKDNDGVAAFVQRIPGALGYVEWAYVKQNHMVYTAMRNAAGAVVQPDTETFKAAAASADWSKSFYQILTNEPTSRHGPSLAQPSCFLHTAQDKPEVGKETLRFFDWAFAHGGQDAQNLDYISLPQSVVSEIRSQRSAKVKDTTGKPLTQ